MATNNLCGYCNESGTKICAGCKNMKYCGKDHQVRDWKSHKQLCKTFADYQEHPRECYRRAILLPEKSKQPCFIWIPVYGEDASESYNGLRASLPRLGGFLGEDEPDEQAIALARHPHGHDLYMRYRGSCKVDGSQPNECVSFLTNGYTEMRHKGPLVLYGIIPATELEPESTADLDTTDLALSIKRLIEHHHVNLQRASPRETIGVVILNPQLAAEKAAAVFNNVYLPDDHRVFTGGTPSTISSLIGTPLLTMEYPCGSFEAAEELRSELTPAAFLHTNLDEDTNGRITEIDDANNTFLPRFATFGEVPAYWIGNTSSILVVRADKASITDHEVEAICRYALLEVPRLTEGRDPREALRLISEKDRWEDFVSLYEEEAGSEAGDLAEKLKNTVLGGDGERDSDVSAAE